MNQEVERARRVHDKQGRPAWQLSLACGHWDIVRRRGNLPPREVDCSRCPATESAEGPAAPPVESVAVEPVSDPPQEAVQEPDWQVKASAGRAAAKARRDREEMEVWEEMSEQLKDPESKAYLGALVLELRREVARLKRRNRELGAELKRVKHAKRLQPRWRVVCGHCGREAPIGSRHCCVKVVKPAPAGEGGSA